MMVLLVLIAACGCVSETEEKDRNSTSTENVSPEIHTWLQEHAIPFDTVEPGGEYEDLMPLKEIIGDARIVALGEATHGTSEFFKTKHRMLEFLVNEMDFNLFAIEDSCLGSNMINNYVHTGEGDPEELLAGLSHWPWNTQEVLDMIKWMRKHNENLGNAPEVSFFGFDPQKIFMAMDKVIEYLEMIDPEAAADVKSLYSPFRSFMDAYKGSESLEKAQNFLKIPLSEKDLYKENVRDVYALLEAHQS
ncbi:MAG: erythromycin esterase family protein, partial [Euryarchaeota archaeon]|nr:erythromycin esterase family protein [Euryarchaeota archaeon]